MSKALNERIARMHSETNGPLNTRYLTTKKALTRRKIGVEAMVLLFLEGMMVVDGCWLGIMRGIDKGYNQHCGGRGDELAFV